MACTSPLKAWKFGKHSSGKQKLVFKEPENSWRYEIQQVPCGKCISCKLDYSSVWATRILHELQTSGTGEFITLTFDDEHLPEDRSVNIKDIQAFMKAFRKQIALKTVHPITGKRICIYQKLRYFACGEYGDKKARPHYHIIILGYQLPDREYFKMSPSGEPLYRSSTLEKCWKRGYSLTAEVNYNTAAYCARYTLKKTKTKGGYEHVDNKTGEIQEVKPEFVTMSGGIGRDWWLKYNPDTDKDFILVNGKKARIPRYYDKLREVKDPESLAEIKKAREIKAKENPENIPSRRRARNIVKQVQSKQLIRGYEK